MARARRTVVIEPEGDALDKVVMDDVENTATEVSVVLDELRSAITDESQVLLYKLPPRGGPWEYIKTLNPPINADSILEDLKEDWGGGQYMFRVRANGRIAASKRVSIAGPPKTPGMESGRKTDEMLPLILQMQQKSSSENMQMMTLMMTQMQQSAQQNQQMMMGMMTAIIPAMTSGRESTASLLQAFAALQAANTNHEKGGSMEETLKLLALAKEMFSSDGGGDDNMFTTALKTFGPGLMDAVGKAQQGALPNTGNALPPPRMQPHNGPPMPQRMGPNPIHAPSPQTNAPPSPMLQPRAPSDPVLAAVGEDVVFFARKRYPVDLAADAVLERIQQAGVSENDIMALVIRFNSSADWIADCAAEGLDLTAHREWANAFLAELVRQYTEGAGEADNSAGDDGGEGDTI